MQQTNVAIKKLSKKNPEFSILKTSVFLNREGLIFKKSCEIIGDGEFKNVYALVDDENNKIGARGKFKSPEYLKRFANSFDVINALPDNPYLCRSWVVSYESTSTPPKTNSENKPLIQKVIIMEYMPSDLFETINEVFLRNRVINESTGVNIMHQIASGICALHKAGIAYLDIKPENILVSWNSNGKPHIKLTDFDLSLMEKSVWIHHARGSFGWTPDEMFSSNFQGSLYKVDIGSLGILFLMLDRMSQGKVEEACKICSLILPDDGRLVTTPLRILKNYLPEVQEKKPLRELIRKMIQIEWHLRPTAQDVLEETEKRLDILEKLECAKNQAERAKVSSSHALPASRSFS